MKYLDANFFVFALLDNTEIGERARTFQKDIIDGEYPAVTSSLTIDEILWVLVRNNRRDLIEAVVDDIYLMPNLNVVATSSAAPKNAVKYMLKYNLKPRDALHLSVMEELKIKEIISDDVDFDRVKGIKRIGIA